MLDEVGGGLWGQRLHPSARFARKRIGLARALKACAAGDVLIVWWKAPVRETRRRREGDSNRRSLPKVERAAARLFRLAADQGDAGRTRPSSASSIRRASAGLAKD